MRTRLNSQFLNYLTVVLNSIHICEYLSVAWSLFLCNDQGTSG
jgi:hypothetical protein